MLASAIIGTWSALFLTVTLRQDGTLEARLPDGSDSEGRWSVESNGRLRADVRGAEQIADASVQGAWLTLSIEGHTLRLQRASAT